MKRTLFVVTLISTFFLFFAGNDDQTTNKSSAIPFIKVQNYDKAEATIMRYYKNDFKTINNKDVKIFYYKGDSGYIDYYITYFHNFSGKMNCFGATIPNKKKFKEAAATWINDTTVLIQIFNSKTGDTVKNTLFGNCHYKDQITTKISGIKQ